MDFSDIGLHLPEIMLPEAGTDLTRWAVVACDQYTSQPEYWQKADSIVGDAPSTLRMILPEVYLNKPEEEKIISSANKTMLEYEKAGVLKAGKPGFVLVDRKTSHADSRKGLVVALDLECYDYSVGSTTLIRATEGTIVDRLPPRMRVRRDATIELPHIMVLIDDPEKTVIEPLFEDGREVVYDFELMCGGGHIRGWKVDDEKSLNQIAAALRALSDVNKFEEKHGVSGQGVMLYAMGDGNHSLATAKSIWEETKAAAKDASALADHPARFALVELVNLHDGGLEFEPIHRVVFEAELAPLVEAYGKYCSANGGALEDIKCASSEDACRKAEELLAAGEHAVNYVTAQGSGVLTVKNPWLTLPVGTLQQFLDVYLPQIKSEVDYIHGSEAVEELGGKVGNIGFYLPAINKGDFFRTIVRDGVLPRKTFSMGEADEKRFYLECRRIKP